MVETTNITSDASDSRFHILHHRYNRLPGYVRPKLWMLDWVISQHVSSIKYIVISTITNYFYVSNASKWWIYPRVRQNPGPGCFCFSSRWTDHYPKSSLNNLCNSKLIPAPCFLQFSHGSLVHWSPIQMFYLVSKVLQMVKSTVFIHFL